MPFILGTNSIKDTGFDVANSVRFDDGSSDSFNRTPSSAGSTRLATFSFWLKRGHFGITPYLYMVKDGSNNQFGMHIDSNDKLVCFHYNGSSYDFSLTSTSQFRDPSAWYHFVIKIDTANGTAIERLKLFVNGVYDPWNTTISQNFDGIFLKDASTYIGSSTTPHAHYDGYFAEYVVIDGTALEPTSFGEFDSDSPTIWKPIDVSGLTFGTNGFYLDFENSGSLGADVSGNSNNFTVNNLTSIDQSSDSCTNNFATLNPLSTVNQYGQRHVALSEGNLFAVGNSSSNNGNAYTTMAVNTGKWYCEIKATDVRGSSYPNIGVCNETCHNKGGQVGSDSSAGVDTVAYIGDGRKVINGTASSYGAGLSDNDIVGIALDLDNGAVYFSVNGTFQASGDPTSGSSKTNAAHTFTVGDYYFFAISVYEAASDVSCNFGSPAYAISSGNTDGNGYGNMEFAIPSGYYVLNSKNLSEYG